MNYVSLILTNIDTGWLVIKKIDQQKDRNYFRVRLFVHGLIITCSDNFYTKFQWNSLLIAAKFDSKGQKNVS